MVSHLGDVAITIIVLQAYGQDSVSESYKNSDQRTYEKPLLFVKFLKRSDRLCKGNISHPLKP